MPYLFDVFVGAIVWAIASVVAAILFSVVVTTLKKGTR